MENQTLNRSEVKLRFDEVLQFHFERLAGARTGMKGLPLNLETITALMLLMEREMDCREGPSPRFTKQSLRGEMAENSVDDEADVSSALEHLEEKGYFSVNDQEMLESGEHVTTMTTIMDKLFPNMPGLLFIAYYVQTLEEVLSGRKALGQAVDQFNQALSMHGVSAKKAKKPAAAEIRPEPSSQQAVKALEALMKRAASPRVTFREAPEPEAQQGVFSYAMEDFGAPKTQDAPGPEADAGAAPGINAQTLPDQPEETPLQAVPGIPAPPGARDSLTGGQPMAPGGQIPREEPPSAMEKALESPAATPENQEAAAPPEPVEEIRPEPQPAPEPALLRPEPEPVPQAPVEEEEAAPSGEVVEADVMERVAEFEESLAMQCPLCGVGKVKSQLTAKGKLFFLCSDRSCQFISWGRPHHTPCPKCGNTFLVEGTAIEGAAILKCPRATCNHVQPAGGAGEAAASAAGVKKKKRLVRRRVVRR